MRRPSVDSNGMHAIVAAATTNGKRTTSAADQALDMRQTQDDEAELTAGPEQQSGLQAGQPTQPERAREACDDGELHRDQHDTAQHDARRIGGDAGQIEAHAHGDQEHAEQQPLERIDRHLDLAAEFGFSQQQTGDQRTEFHRHADLRGRQAGRQDHQQAGSDEQLRAARARDAAEQWAQHQASGHDQPEHDNHRLNDGPGERPATGADHADDEQHGHRGNILQQQHRQRGTADRSSETLLVRQHLHDHRGG